MKLNRHTNESGGIDILVCYIYIPHYNTLPTNKQGVLQNYKINCVLASMYLYYK